ncbi:MAG: clan AA aspartic protease [Pyrinomonadaceae bacterium]
MGYVHASIEISNPRDSTLAPLNVKALVDTGALMLCIPDHVRLQLKLEEAEKREVMTADGTRISVPYVGPVTIRFENRSCFVGALVLGDEVLLGVVPMEDMDLVVNPAKHEVTVNPDNPNFPLALVK